MFLKQFSVFQKICLHLIECFVCILIIKIKSTLLKDKHFYSRFIYFHNHLYLLYMIVKQINLVKNLIYLSYINCMTIKADI